MTIPFKKAKLVIVAEGCIDCGTQYSSGWFIAKEVRIQVENRTMSLDLHRCSDCNRMRLYSKTTGDHHER